MRILHLVTIRQRRGAEVIASDLADAMCELGHDATVVGLCAPSPDALVPKVARTLDLSRNGNSRLDIRRVAELGQLFEETRPDIIQANGGYAVKYAVLASWVKRLDIPIVYCNIGMSSDWLRWPGQRTWNRWLLKRARVTAAVSEASRRDLIGTYGLSEDRIQVVRRGLATEPVYSRAHGRELLGREGVPAGVPVMMHVGSYTPEKNHAGLLKIFKSVQKSIPEAVLVLVGDGELRADVEARNVPGVFVLGTRSDVPELLSGADVFVLPSITEGIPGAVLEAAVQRVPTVAYDVGGLHEVVDSGVTGCLIPAGDETAASRAVIDLLKDRSRRDSLGAEARTFVCREYDLQGSVEAFLDLYHQALSRPASSISHA